MYDVFGSHTVVSKFRNFLYLNDDDDNNDVVLINISILTVMTGLGAGEGRTRV